MACKQQKSKPQGMSQSQTGKLCLDIKMQTALAKSGPRSSGSPMSKCRSGRRNVPHQAPALATDSACRCRFRFLPRCNVLHVDCFLTPSVREDAGRMCGKDKLHVGVQLQNPVQQFILPTNINIRVLYVEGRDEI